MTARSPQQRRVTAKEGARLTGVSERQVRRLVALPRDEWIAQRAAKREAIRAYHDDGHTWPETAVHFGLAPITVQQQARRARRDRAAAQAATAADTHEDPQSST